ncbi:MAG: B12-binding domain-containing protein [Sulfitobacter sp.]
MPTRSQPDKTEALDGVNRVVLQAISKVAPSGSPVSVARPPLESYIRQMTQGCLAPDRDALTDVVRQMRRARISIPQIAEEYVPAVARRLGDDWLADCLSFSGVTIGSARLQSLLRKLQADWDQSHEVASNSPPGFLVGVPDGVQHTLGAAVLAGQLRHRGLSVHLDMELTVQELGALISGQNYCGILLSGSALGQLESLRELVQNAKQQSRSTPVIIGGPILDQADDILLQTQADFVTNDVHDALRFCDGFSNHEETSILASQLSDNRGFDAARIRSAAE